MSRVAIVTGSNKGIGLAVVELLAKGNPNWTVYLTARSKERGEASLSELKGKGLNNVRFGFLDIDNISSMESLRDQVKGEHGGLDVLVNNAAIAYKSASTAPFSEQAEVTVKTNYYGVLNTCNIFFPILRPHARVVNVSSRAGSNSYAKCSDDIKSRVSSKHLTVDSLSKLMDEFVATAQTGKHLERGFSNSAYGMSKIGVTSLSFLQQAQFDKDRPGQDIVVNACCPGYVVTDMTSRMGNKTTVQGADTLVYLATLPENVKSPRGEFVAERNIISMG